MSNNTQAVVDVIGGGLAGSEAALQLAHRGFQVRLYEMRPLVSTAVHKTSNYAELVCSNSFKSTKPNSAAGMLKEELQVLGSYVWESACKNRVAAGGALAVDRTLFSNSVTQQVLNNENIACICAEVLAINPDGSLRIRRSTNDAHSQATEETTIPANAIILSSGPLTSDALAASIGTLTGQTNMAFYDAAAPIVEADSLDYSKVFLQSRYDKGAADYQDVSAIADTSSTCATLSQAGEGDYLNAPFTKEEYEHFIDELLNADCVIKRAFETKDLFQACQPIEEVARAGRDAPRFGALKPVGLTDPRTGKRPWAVVQLRAEDAHKQSYNLVGFQTNLTFPEQKRVFSLIPGLEHADFSRYGVMHRNTFINAPALLNKCMQLRGTGASPTKDSVCSIPVYIAGQLAGTEGYTEAIRAGLHVSLAVAAYLRGVEVPLPPTTTVFGALLSYASNPETVQYQPMHVNFGIMPPLPQRIKNKQQRYHAYAQRGTEALHAYRRQLQKQGLL